VNKLTIFATSHYTILCRKKSLSYLCQRSTSLVYQNMKQRIKCNYLSSTFRVNISIVSFPKLCNPCELCEGFINVFVNEFVLCLFSLLPTSLYYCININRMGLYLARI